MERLLAEMRGRSLDGLLLFRQESLYWLTGYDSLGYVFFQCLYVGTDGRIALFSRPQDVEQAKHTSVIEDVIVWQEQDDASPAYQFAGVVRDMCAVGSRLGVEWEAHGLTALKARALESALADVYELIDASDLVARLRAVKSPAELDHVRRAARLADEALSEVRRRTVPGRFDGDILATLHDVIFRGGGGYPANECIVNSGDEALLLRHHAGRRYIGDQDQVLVEFAAPYRRYHVGMLQTILTGKPTKRQIAMHEACRDAFAAASRESRPGNSLGGVFDAQAAILDAAGFGAQRLHTCGYGLGATFPPTWVDWPMLYSGNPEPVVANMTLLLLIILIDREHGNSMGVGRTVLVTDNGGRSLTETSTDL